jgi:hypothetical protein
MILYDITKEEERRFLEDYSGSSPEQYFYQEFGEVTWSDPAELPDLPSEEAQ